MVAVIFCNLAMLITVYQTNTGHRTVGLYN